MVCPFATRDRTQVLRAKRGLVFSGKNANAGQEKPGGSFERRARHCIVAERITRLINVGQTK
jgi:hypothetical protein